MMKHDKSHQLLGNWPPLATLPLRAGSITLGAFGTCFARAIHAISVKIVTIDNQIAQVQAYAEHKRSIGGLVAVGFNHVLLELDGRAQRINGAGELDQRAVARQLDQTASVFRQNRIEMFRMVLA
jgi:hypothetical protein